METGIRGFKPRRCGDAVDETRVIEYRRIVDERGKWLPVPFDKGYRTRPARLGEFDPVSRGVDVDLGSGKPVTDSQRRVAERSCKRVPQRARRHASELDHEIPHGRPFPRRTQELHEQPDRDSDERQLVAQQYRLVRVTGREDDSGQSARGKHAGERGRRLHDRHPCTALHSYRSEIAPNRDRYEQGSEKDRRDLASTGCGHERRRVADRDAHTVDAGASSADGIGENAVDERAAVEINQ